MPSSHKSIEDAKLQFMMNKLFQESKSKWSHKVISVLTYLVVELLPIESDEKLS